MISEISIVNVCPHLRTVGIFMYIWFDGIPVFDLLMVEHV